MTYEGEHEVRRIGPWVNLCAVLSMVATLLDPEFSWVVLVSAALALNQARLCWREDKIRKIKAEIAALEAAIAENTRQMQAEVRRMDEFNRKAAEDLAKAREVSERAREQREGT